MGGVHESEAEPAATAVTWMLKAASDVVAVMRSAGRKVMSRMALDEGDFTTFNFLQWFVNEQLEETATAAKLNTWFDEIGEDRVAQFELLIGEMQEHAGE